MEERPYEIWNAFVSLLAAESYANLDLVQRCTYLCFWYDSELQNGGHLQYFENRQTSLVPPTLEALKQLGAECQFAVLKRAARLVSAGREKSQTVEDFVNLAKAREFEQFDSAFYACEPSIKKLLEKYLQEHLSHFVEIIE